MIWNIQVRQEIMPSGVSLPGRIVFGYSTGSRKLARVMYGSGYAVLPWFSFLGFVMLVFFLFSSQAVFAHHKEIRVGLLTQRFANDPFWHPVEKFMRAACNDLRIHLTVYHAASSREKMLQTVERAHQDGLDVLVFPNLKKTAARMIMEADKKKLHTYLFNADVAEENKHKVGEPGEKYPYWIGKMMPEDTMAGYMLANLLIDTAIRNQKVDEDGKVHVVGISGTFVETASTARAEGLEMAVSRRDDVVLHQTVYASWDKHTSKSMAKGLMSRYPQATVFWAASDLMSIGIIEAIEAKKRKPGIDFFTGGVDWTEEAMGRIKNGQMVASIGGHFMEGGWIAVILYDYFHGISIDPDERSMRSPMMVLDNQNVREFSRILKKGDWEYIDFTRLSKKLNSSVKKYHFSPEISLK